jgi:4-alpha-glucanotransferase
MHISSLPSRYGIGDFGQEAYKFVEFLEKSGQKHWQILPLGITGYGDSPYQCFSAFAGNPYFIDLEVFIEDGSLTQEALDHTDFGDNPECVNYGLLYENKMKLLRKAYKKSGQRLEHELETFYQTHKAWLREFALFMAIKAHHQNQSWIEWEPQYKNARSEAVTAYESTYKREIYFWVFTQYYFSKQWKQLKSFANDRGISIIGDLPIYVAQDSADVWSNPELFYLNNELIPVTVAGCPPDSFTKTGQLWGNPIYDWSSMEQDEFKWWTKRIYHSFDLYDVLRIDHFRGFESYWEVSYGSVDAVNGKWVRGPGIKLFNKIKNELGDLNIIAEDLGFLTDEVNALIKDTGYPGMKVLQFAFDSREESDYLPHNYSKNAVVYTGTHDNETASGWFDTLSKEDFLFAARYLKLNYDEGLHWGLIRGAWSSTAYLAVAPMQDFLGLDNRARMNTPSTIGTNWTWRMDRQALTDELAGKIAKLTRLYRR